MAMSRHGALAHFKPSGTGGEWRNVLDPKEQLTFGPGRHPRVYAAINSHAIYNRAQIHWVSKRAFSFDWVAGTVSADIVDRTKEGEAFEAWRPERYRIITSDLPGCTVAAPDWLYSGGRWGKHERLKENVCKFEHWVILKWSHLK